MAASETFLIDYLPISVGHDKLKNHTKNSYSDIYMVKPVAVSEKVIFSLQLAIVSTLFLT